MSSAAGIRKPGRYLSIALLLAASTAVIAGVVPDAQGSGNGSSEAAEGEWKRQLTVCVMDYRNAHRDRERFELAVGMCAREYPREGVALESAGDRTLDYLYSYYSRFLRPCLLRAGFVPRDPMLEEFLMGSGHVGRREESDPREPSREVRDFMFSKCPPP